MWQIFREGRCLRCGMRVTVDCEPDGHWRDGRCCGPVETERPFTAPDEPPSADWMVPVRGGHASA